MRNSRSLFFIFLLCANRKLSGERNLMQKMHSTYRRRTKVRQRGRVQLKSHTQKMKKPVDFFDEFQPFIVYSKF